MGAGGTIAAGKASRGNDQTTYRFTSKDRAVSAIINKAKDLWRCKIAVQLAAATGVSVRTAENWLSGDRSIGAGALVALLQGDDGFHFLEAIVETMPKRQQRRWREEFDRAARRAERAARLAALQREEEQDPLL